MRNGRFFLKILITFTLGVILALALTWPTPRPTTITVSDVNLVDSLLQRCRVLEGDAKVSDWNNRAMVRQLELFEAGIVHRDSIIREANLTEGK